MHCWTCGAPATGCCRFCGRAVCKQHAQLRPFLFEAWDDGEDLRALAVDDALFCGICKPRPEPIDANFLRPARRRPAG